MSVLLGVNAFPAGGEGGGRQSRALATWRALAGVRLANLQWADGACEVEGFATHPVLRADARTVSGRRGRRLPVLNEAMDRLAELAEEAGCGWFAYANSDVAYTQAAVDRMAAGGEDGLAFSRMDVDPATGRDLEMVTAGVDVFAVSTAWWRAHRRRFRAYLGGEPVWDNVYTAILLAHGRALLLNREPLIRHERHSGGDWSRSPYARYLNHLAALDRPYFTLWAAYHAGLEALRARGAAEAEELRLQREVFSRRPSPLERAVQAGRVVKAVLRRAARRRGGG
ncbi:MAG: hypothetical protein ACJ8GN_11425 [Longimicrobiaceae bacterium]